MTKAFGNSIGRLRIWLPSLAAGLAPVAADPGPQELAFLEMPGMLSLLPAPGNAREFEAAQMDPHLRGLAERVIEGQPRRVASESGETEFVFEPMQSYSGFEHDLDDDGRAEVFLLHPNAGGSGGWAYEVFSHQKGVWRQVASLQAVRLWLGKSEEGAPVLVSIGRAGGSSYTRVWRQPAEGAWRTVRVEDYDIGTITERARADFADWEAALPFPPLSSSPARPARRGEPQESGGNPAVMAKAPASDSPPSGRANALRTASLAAWWLAGLLLLSWLWWRIRRSGPFRLKP